MVTSGMQNIKKTTVKIGNIILGANHPVVLQSMTNTDTADVAATTDQILELEKAGAQIVRITVNNEDAAQAVPQIVKNVQKISDVPIVGDFHFNGNLLLKKYPDCAKSLDKYRINPGNARDQNFQEIIELAIKYDKPVRIGVNSGSVDAEILDDLMAKNTDKTSEEILEEAAIKSVLNSAQLAEKIGLPKNKIVLSAKMSEINSMIRVYTEIAKSNYVLHLGLTEAGQGDFGIVSSSIALGVLLNKGIGHTIRVSLTPLPGESRTREVEMGKMILQSLGLRNFAPRVTSCPGCGRTSSDQFQHLALKINERIQKTLPEWKEKYPDVENLKIAVMGCVVNGPGEAKNADIGISLPGKAEKPIASVFVSGKHFCDLKGDNIEDQFWQILEDFVKKNC